jgi:Cupredoxin-like domain
MIRIRCLGLASFLIAGGAAASAGESAVVRLTLRGASFDPAEVEAPAHTPLVFEIANLDGAPAEFESSLLRAQRIVAAGGKVVVEAPPLAPGRYRIFDFYREASAEGFLVVK